MSSRLPCSAGVTALWLAVGWLGASPALAQMVQVQAKANEMDFHTATNPYVAAIDSSTVGESDEQAYARAYGKSETGQVRNLVETSINTVGTGASYTFATANSMTRFAATDIMVTDLAGSPVSGIRQASVNFDLSGTMSFFSDPKPGSFGVQSMGDILINLAIRQGSTEISVGNFQISGSVLGSNPDIDWSSYSSGIFLPYTPTSATGELATTITTDNFLFNAALPLEITATLTTTAWAKGYFQAVVAQTTDFSHTFGWSTSGPVFNLEDGLTVSSLEGGLHGNTFIVVPEPSQSFWLNLLGAAVLVVGWRRRRA